MSATTVQVPPTTNAVNDGASSGEEREFKCDREGCTKAFKSKYSLKRHHLSHLEVKKYECDQCKRRFTLKQYLKEHIYTHTGEKPYLCPFEGCGQRFRQASKLSLHRKSHKLEQARLQQQKLLLGSGQPGAASAMNIPILANHGGVLTPAGSDPAMLASQNGFASPYMMFGNGGFPQGANGMYAQNAGGMYPQSLQMMNHLQHQQQQTAMAAAAAANNFKGFNPMNGGNPSMGFMPFQGNANMGGCTQNGPFNNQNMYFGQANQYLQQQQMQHHQQQQQHHYHQQQLNQHMMMMKMMNPTSTATVATVEKKPDIKSTVKEEQSVHTDKETTKNQETKEVKKDEIKDKPTDDQATSTIDKDTGSDSSANQMEESK